MNTMRILMNASAWIPPTPPPPPLNTPTAPGPQLQRVTDVECRQMDDGQGPHAVYTVSILPKDRPVPYALPRRGTAVSFLVNLNFDFAFNAISPSPAGGISALTSWRAISYHKCPFRYPPAMCPALFRADISLADVHSVSETFDMVRSQNVSGAIPQRESCAAEGSAAGDDGAVALGTPLRGEGPHSPLGAGVPHASAPSLFPKGMWGGDRQSLGRTEGIFTRPAQRGELYCKCSVQSSVG